MVDRVLDPKDLTMGEALRNGEQKERGACLAFFKPWVRKNKDKVSSRHLPGPVPRKHSTTGEIHTKETLVKKVLCGPGVRSWVLESGPHIKPTAAAGISDPVLLQ